MENKEAKIYFHLRPKINTTLKVRQKNKTIVPKSGCKAKTNTGKVKANTGNIQNNKGRFLKKTCSLRAIRYINAKGELTLNSSAG